MVPRWEHYAPIRPIEEVLAEVDRYAAGESRIQLAAAEIAKLLSEMGIDYAMAGALALDAHGFRRLTEDVDVLLRREDLARFKERWLGRGYAEVVPGGKAILDTAREVKIHFLLAGDFPGDGRPKPMAFPDPRDVAVRAGRYDFSVIALPPLIELKIACGLSAPHRLGDLSDAIRLIRARSLPRDFAEQLDPYVRPKFDEFWTLAQHPEEDY